MWVSACQRATATLASAGMMSSACWSDPHPLQNSAEVGMLKTEGLDIRPIARLLNLPPSRVAMPSLGMFGASGLAFS